MKGHILVIDDERSMVDLLRTDLTLRGYQITGFTSASEALDEMKATTAQVALTDLNMPHVNGLQLCERFVANRPDVPVVVMTAFGSMETAISAIRAGAWDFVTKPVEMELLDVVLDRAVRHHLLQEEVRRLSDKAHPTDRFEELIGASPAMKKLFDQIRKIAPTTTTVLITGESGTGKELVAQAIHRHSARKNGPFVAINCAAIPENLLESELFGHSKGSFTDALSDRKGLFQQAHGGTLLLDEIGDFPLSLQAKLLRAMEQRSVRPVGSDHEIPFDVRILAATNRDLELAVEEGRYREDFYFRINVIQLEIPPLRSRGTDVLLIASGLLHGFAREMNKKVSDFLPSVAERILNYDWPGNVRELRNVMERAVALTEFEILIVDDLPERIRDYRQSTFRIDTSDPAELQTLEAVEQRYIRRVLESAQGNRTEAARILGVDRKTLYRHLKQSDGFGKK